MRISIIFVILTLYSSSSFGIHKTKSTPLISAAQGGDLTTAKQLIDEGACVKLADSRGYTPIFWATYYGHKDLVELLVTAGAEVNQACTPNEETPLIWAALRGHKAVAEFLVHECKADSNAADIWGHTPLLLAASKGYLDIVKLLITAGAEVERADNRNLTPLWRAAANGHLNIVKFLVEEGHAEVQSHPAYKMCQTPLRIAADNGHRDVVKFLVAAGTDVNKRDELGRTHLHYAADYGTTETVKYLVRECGAELNPADHNGDTPFWLATGQGHLDIGVFLLCQRERSCSVM